MAGFSSSVGVHRFSCVCDKDSRRKNEHDLDQHNWMDICFKVLILYGAETWTMRKHERRKIDAFELWCWRRVLRVSWMERKTNISIIESIKPEWTQVKGDKGCIELQGHVVRAGGMEDDVSSGE